MDKSIWEQDVKATHFTKLEESATYDVCIIGAGICGIYSAYLLAKKGFKVVLVDADEQIGGGATKRSTGKLTTQHGTVYQKLKEEDRTLYYEANEESIQKIINEVSVSSYEKVTSYLTCHTEQGEQTLRKEFECYKKLPFTPIATDEVELPLDVKLAIGIPNMYQIHPARFTDELTKLAVEAGVTIHTSTRIVKIVPSKKTVISEDGNEIQCKHLLLCTHYPIESIKNFLTVKLKIVRSYLAAVPTYDLLSNHYYNIDNPARTIRTALIGGRPHLIYGGGSHFAGTVRETKPYYETLENELKTVFQIPNSPVVWSSQDIETADQLPYVGSLAKNDDFIFIATGFKKWGLSTSLLAAEILMSSIVHEHHKAKHLFDPHRSTKASQFVSSIAQASFVFEQLVAGYVARMKAPKCTHLGCKTRWNEGDKTWDCPCHGSRFSIDGEVIEGPAVYPLKIRK